MQESVLEHAAPEARQNQGLTSRLAEGDYPENPGLVKWPVPASIKTQPSGDVVISFNGSQFADFAKENPTAVFHVRDGGYSYPISVPLYWESQPDGTQT